MPKMYHVKTEKETFIIIILGYRKRIKTIITIIMMEGVVYLVIVVRKATIRTLNGGVNSPNG